jgi:hypothetical protein
MGDADHVLPPSPVMNTSLRLESAGTATPRLGVVMPT